jgi:hypothetical protein
VPDAATVAPPAGTSTTTGPADASEQAAAQRVFSTALLVSATRCLLTYVVLPFIAPALGFATGVGPGVGIAIGIVAIGANLVTIRRFHRAEHRLRWSYTAVAAGVIGLLLVLMVQDIARLL